MPNNCRLISFIVAIIRIVYNIHFTRFLNRESEESIPDTEIQWPEYFTIHAWMYRRKIDWNFSRFINMYVYVRIWIHLNSTIIITNDKNNPFKWLGTFMWLTINIALPYLAIFVSVAVILTRSQEKSKFTRIAIRANVHCENLWRHSSIHWNCFNSATEPI